MRVQVNQERCISSGQCVLSAPEVFDQREDDGVVFLRTGTPPADQAQDVRRAASLCPAAAITVTEEQRTTTVLGVRHGIVDR